jgi:hypothetical protein
MGRTYNCRQCGGSRNKKTNKCSNDHCPSNGGHECPGCEEWVGEDCHNKCIENPECFVCENDDCTQVDYFGHCSKHFIPHLDDYARLCTDCLEEIWPDVY